jgi:hypothetical protein
MNESIAWAEAHEKSTAAFETARRLSEEAQAETKVHRNHDASRCPNSNPMFIFIYQGGAGLATLLCMYGHGTARIAAQRVLSDGGVCDCRRRRRGRRSCGACQQRHERRLWSAHGPRRRRPGRRSARRSWSRHGSLPVSHSMLSRKSGHIIGSVRQRHTMANANCQPQLLRPSERWS